LSGKQKKAWPITLIDHQQLHIPYSAKTTSQQIFHRNITGRWYLFAQILHRLHHASGPTGENKSAFAAWSARKTLQGLMTAPVRLDCRHRFSETTAKSAMKARRPAKAISRAAP
jgi:hypothetical protein